MLCGGGGCCLPSAVDHLFAEEAQGPEAGFLSIGLSAALHFQVVLLGPDQLG